jgi:hypothetical protein
MLGRLRFVLNEMLESVIQNCARKIEPRVRGTNNKHLKKIRQVFIDTSEAQPPFNPNVTFESPARYPLYSRDTHDVWMRATRANLRLLLSELIKVAETRDTPIPYLHSLSVRAHSLAHLAPCVLYLENLDARSAPHSNFSIKGYLRKISSHVEPSRHCVLYLGPAISLIFTGSE